MKRKEFLKVTSMGGASLMLGSSAVHASNLLDSPLLHELARSFNACNKVLVIIQLGGGNDGLNFTIPLNSYANLVAARPNIVPPQSQVLSLNGNPTTGMHPALTELRNLYNNNKVCIVQGVSYDNPNYSHFRATDIWQSGSDSTQIINTGWLGRFLQVDNPGFPNGYPNANMPDPLAIQIGNSLPLTLQGDTINLGYNVDNPNDLINVINATTDPSPANDYGRELTFLRLMKDQSNAYTTGIRAAYNSNANLYTQYPDEELSNQLKIVARLIKGGLRTAVYIVNHPNSWDHHDNQVVSGNPLAGKHAINMSILSKAIGAFQNDIELMNVANKVCGMTFSEFGRTIKGNGSLGTDHGVGAPVIFFGTQVKGGMIGTSPTIPANATYDDQVPMQYDYRQVYSTILQKWLCVNATDSGSILLNNYSTLDIFIPNVTLAIQLVSFNAVWKNADAQLSWQVANTNNIESFEVQVSKDKQNYTSLGFVPIDLAKTNYEFLHRNAGETNYYRIVTKEKSGEKSTSNVVRLQKTKTGEGQVVVISPNPIKAASPILRLNLIDVESGEFLVNMYSEMGSLVYQYGRSIVNENTIPININKAVTPGVYLIWVSLPSGYKKAHKVIFQ